MGSGRGFVKSLWLIKSTVHTLKLLSLNSDTEIGFKHSPMLGARGERNEEAPPPPLNVLYLLENFNMHGSANRSGGLHHVISCNLNYYTKPLPGLFIMKSMCTAR